MKSKISVTIITLNEEEDIRRCLESLKPLDAEIIVVDSGSTDKTLQIAKEFTDKIFIRSFDDFSNQKNWAASKASNEWILSVDPDEQISKELAEEIKNAISQNKVNAFLIGRRNFILGKEIKYSRWSPDMHIWLWKKDMGHWKGKVHEEVIVQGSIGALKNKKIHHQSDTITGFVKSNNLYSSLEAIDRHDSKVKFSLFRLFYDPLVEFLIRYIYKLGFMDGIVGFILACLMAIYKISVWVKIYELQNSVKKL